MINDLEQFSVERLEALAETTTFPSLTAVRKLARIALKAKLLVGHPLVSFDSSPEACRNAVENGCADNIHAKTTK